MLTTPSPVVNIDSDDDADDDDTNLDCVSHCVLVCLVGILLVCGVGVLGAIVGFPIYACMWFILYHDTCTLTEYMCYLTLLCIGAYHMVATCVRACRHLAIRFVAVLIVIAITVMAIRALPLPIVTTAQSMLFWLDLYMVAATGIACFGGTCQTAVSTLRPHDKQVQAYDSYDQPGDGGSV